MTEPLESQLVVDDDTGAGLYLPPGWERVEVPGYGLVMAGPASQAAADGSTFRPSINVLPLPVAPDTDIRTLGSQAIAAATVVADDAHVLAYDLWPGPGEADGRRLEFAYQQDAVPLSVIQWIVLQAATAWTVTGTCGIAQLTATRPYLDHAIAGLRLPGGTR